MKLLLYSHFFAPSIGGVETIVLSLARGLTELRNLNVGPEFEIKLVTQTPAQDYHGGALPFRVVRRPNDPVALAGVMKRILDEAGLAASLGMSARTRVLRSFSRQSMVEAHAQRYREVRTDRKLPDALSK